MPFIIPQELYRDIILHLNHDHDSGTRALLSTAQCSWALRNEAQRVLFRNPFVFLWQDSDIQNCGGFPILRSHEAFLKAILGAPTRLGPLVRSYNQFQVSYNQQETDSTMYIDYMENRKGQRGQIFELTEKALPYMTNLKSLYFMTPNGLPTSPKVLLRCNFHLEVMEWYAPGKKHDIAALLLPRQQTLRHLDVLGWDAGKVDSESISRNLVSVKGSLQDLAALARGRNIVAFEYHEAIHTRNPRNIGMAPPRPDDVLGHLRYLRVVNYNSYLRLFAGSSPTDIFPNLLLLEIVFWTSDEIQTYTLLPPKLQMLILINRMNTDSSTQTEDVAMSAFTAAPHLRFIDVRAFYQPNSSVIVHRYCNRLRESAAADMDSDAGRPERMSRKTIIFDRGWGDSWWRERAASLGWIEATDEMSYTFRRGHDTEEPRAGLCLVDGHAGL